MNALRKIVMINLFFILANVPFFCVGGDTLFDSQITTDRYRWMEVEQGRTAQWLELRTKQSRKILDALPRREETQKQLHDLNDPEGVLSDIFYAGENHFYLRSTPAFFYLRLFVKRKDGREQLLIDPPVGTGIHFFLPSYDGRYIAYGLSDNGSEFSSINILDAENGGKLADIIPHVRYPHIVWRADNRSFFYKRMLPAKQDASPSERLTGEKIYLHQIGDSYDMDKVVFDGFMMSEDMISQYDNVDLYSSPDSKWLLSSATESISGYTSTIFAVRADALNGSKTPWKRIIDRGEKVARFVFSGKWLYLARYNDASGYNITRMNLDAPELPEENIIKWAGGELTGFITSNEALYITYHEMGVRKFVRIPFENVINIKHVTRPFDGEITALFSSPDRKEILFTLQGWTIPPGIFRYDPDKDMVKNTQLIAPQSYDYFDYEAKEVRVISKDNVHVPLTIIHKRGIKLDSAAPVWLTAYGAYGVSTFPNFDPSRLLWLRNGGVIAIAHVRGGGELGPLWHEGGRASNKMNSIIYSINLKTQV